MRLIKFFLISLFLISLNNCSTIKKGFESQRKNGTDEFLVEKKKPLTMPPNYNELPLPKQKSLEIETEENEIKSLIVKDNKVSKEKINEKDKTFEDLLLKKIKDN